MKNMIKTKVLTMLAAFGLVVSSFAAQNKYSGGTWCGQYGYENSLANTTEYGFRDDSVTSFTKSSSVAASQYAQCPNLKSADLTGVTSIGDAAFAYSGLTSVTIPAGCSEIGYIAFGGCSNLTTLTVSDFSWYDANKEPFAECSKLTTVTVNSTAVTPPNFNLKSVFSSLSKIYVPTQTYVSRWNQYIVNNGISGVSVAITPPNYFSVAYDFDGGVSGVTVPATIKTNTLTTISAPTKSGYVFAGWKVISGTLTDAAYYWVSNSDRGSILNQYHIFGSGSDKCQIRDLVALGETVTLKAVWVKSNQYAIAYDYNGGTALSASKAPEAGTVGAWTAIYLPTRTGYIFAGWKVSSGVLSSGATSYNNGTFVSITGNDQIWGTENTGSLIKVKNLTAAGKAITLKAVWVKSNQYAIAYDYNGGTALSASKVCLVNAIPKEDSAGYYSGMYDDGAFILYVSDDFGVFTISTSEITETVYVSVDIVGDLIVVTGTDRIFIIYSDDNVYSAYEIDSL